MIVSGTELLKALNVSPGKKHDHDTIDNMGQLQEIFSYYFSKGSAAERPFTDQMDYQRIIQVAETLSHVEVCNINNSLSRAAVDMFRTEKSSKILKLE